MFDNVLRSKFKNLDGEISYINEMLKSATDYGGDDGGPYCTNPEDLKFKINNWLAHKNITDDFEVYIVNEKFSPPYVQIRPIHKEIPTLSAEHSIGYYDMIGGRDILAIMAKVQMMNTIGMNIIETVDTIARGDLSSNLTIEQLNEINDELDNVKEIYERILSKIISITNNDSDKTTIECSNGIKFRFNDYKDAVSFLIYFTDYLAIGKSVTVAKAYRLYGVSNNDINDEKRGWRGEVKVTVETSLEGENRFYYAVIHDDPVKLF